MSSSVPARRFSLGRVAVIGLLAAAAAGAYYYYVLATEGKVEPVDIRPSLREFARTLKKSSQLATGYEDKDGDKLADPPGDSAKVLNPDVIMFTVVAQDDPADAEKLWQPLMEHLAKATGKPVKYLKQVPPSPGNETVDGQPGPPEDLRTTEQQIAAVRDGRLHVTAFNTGAVPLAVNSAGFHPLFTPADDQDRYDYQMQIIVAGNSLINDPAELKGKSLGLVALSSNSGGRAPMVLLHEKFGLLPGRDYTYVLTGRHERSIQELTGGLSEPKFEAACVASDILAQMIADQRVDPSRVKVIFTSSSFPKLTFGVPHHLAPELRAKIVTGFQSFRFAGTPLAKAFAAERRTKFAPIEYTKAFADVLATDTKLIELLDAPVKTP